MHRCTRVLIGFMTASCLLSLTGCTTLGYYTQSIAGQMEILAKRRPIDAVMNDPALPAATRHRLVLVTELRRFASAELKLPDNDSYRDYAALGRRFVVWNVFATPELSLEPLRSCFLVVGCLSYRGYFREQAARTYARGLEEAGNDVYVGGVAAYSTLGWFDDPVLDTMLPWSEVQTARFIFHELAHQQLYVPDDSAFNEAFAEAAADEGIRRWLAAIGDPQRRQRYGAETAHDRQFVDLVIQAKGELAGLYGSNGSLDEKRRGKAGILAALRNGYDTLRAAWGGDTSYDGWMRSGLNNAKIAAVSTYREDVPAFEAVLTAAQGEMARFFELSARIGALPPTLRRQCLEGLKRHGPTHLRRCGKG